MKNSYLFVHIAFQEGVGFIDNLISFFNSDLNDTVLRDNLWITKSRSLYEKYKDKCDIICENISEIQMINKYGKKGKRIIVHGLHSDGFSVVMIHPNLVKRIIWRTWGHDIYTPTPHPNSMIKTVYRYMSYSLYYQKTKHFPVIGTANIIDDIKVNRVYKNIPTIRIPYCGQMESRKKTIECLENLKKQSTRETENGNPKKQIRIMVGHSGFPIDNHKGIIDDVLHLINDEMMFYIMVPYGDKDYIEEVKRYAKNRLGDQCRFFDKRMDYYDYLQFISRIDIAIFSMKNSAALGNVGYLVYFEKKIYLNPNGDIAKGFDELHVPYKNADSIINETASDFCNKYEYSNDTVKEYVPQYFDADYYTNQWKKVIQEYGN